MDDSTAIWQERLDEALAESPGRFTRAHVLDRVDSTQDEARGLKARPGDVVTALRQTTGRGRSRKAWFDTGMAGLAVSFVVDRASPARSWRLAVASAVAAARAVETFIDQSCGIKWPNDLIVSRRKLAGILIEQHTDVALVGIGINVGQGDWPAELRGRAISMREAGCDVSRLDLLIRLMLEFDRALDDDDATLLAAFHSRDALTGSRATLRSGDREVAGTVQRVDPIAGLTIETERGLVHLPAETVTCLAAEGEKVSL